MNHPRRRSDDRAGVYIHVPFCARLCPYCDFAVTIKTAIPHEEYARALLEEFQARRYELEGRDVRTIYVGGGTPSLWDLNELRRVLDAVRDAYAVSDEAEITLEANPNQVTAGNLRGWTEAGINRLSIGCQSFQARILTALRRNHGPETALDAVKAAIDYMPEVSLDLIFGGPEQIMDEWERDLDVVSTLDGLAHLSAYHLTIEPGTAFFMRHRRGTLVVADDELATDMMERLIDRTNELGFERYEVSNFARGGARSRHNTNYWTGGEYLGLGVGAHGLGIDDDEGVVRRANPRKFDEYMNDPCTPALIEDLDARTHLAERLYLSMRTLEGVYWAELVHQFDPSLLRDARAVLDALVERGMAETDDELSWYGPTGRGLFVADAVAEFVFEKILP
ncbi:MAG: radical SAM family heme chaperone HemW [Bradymonadaceae bacterium]